MGCRIDTRLIIAPFPHVSLSIRADTERLLSAHLFLSDSFSFSFEGPEDTSLYQNLYDSLLLYAAKQAPSFALFPFDLENFTPFQTQVLQAIAQIPFGQTVSYQQLAQTIGRPQAVRAVGTACGKNALPFLIPCHRVIQTNGKIGGFALDLEIKQRLLDFEAERAPSKEDTLFMHSIKEIRL